jgi:hypothetical protein
MPSGFFPSYFVSVAAAGAGRAVKHLRINSLSSCRALVDKTFFNSLRRDNPRRPPVDPELNLRIFSRFRLIFSFLALVRHAASSVETTPNNRSDGEKGLITNDFQREREIGENSRT